MKKSNWTKEEEVIIDNLEKDFKKGLKKFYQIKKTNKKSYVKS
jgi:hypothetical protein